MNYALSKKKAKELLEAKLSHFMGVSPEEATDEQYYKAIALILRDMMSAGRADFSAQAAKAGALRRHQAATAGRRCTAAASASASAAASNPSTPRPR